LLPLKSQQRARKRIRAAQRELYSAAFEKRIDCYCHAGKARTCSDPSRAQSMT
jgi:hypothetical protein